MSDALTERYREKACKVICVRWSDNCRSVSFCWAWKRVAQALLDAHREGILTAITEVEKFGGDSPPIICKKVAFYLGVAKEWQAGWEPPKGEPMEAEWLKEIREYLERVSESPQIRAARYLQLCVAEIDRLDVSVSQWIKWQVEEMKRANALADECDRLTAEVDRLRMALRMVQDEATSDLSTATRDAVDAAIADEDKAGGATP